MTYLDLLLECERLNVIIDEADLIGADGLCDGDFILLRKDIPTQKERACVLAEELGHYYTTVGNILDQKDMKNRKQELAARAWSYQRMVPLYKIIDAYVVGAQSQHELAEYLGVTEEFLLRAIAYYNGKYGISKKVGNYEIYFDPLAVTYIF